ncbi:MAG TPA: hypothetical protein VH120_17440 [Gemmataceae bacterium]|jgi:hypothetical protein|nr:hypothetical protein [Gemmataceae bacterium]
MGLLRRCVARIREFAQFYGPCLWRTFSGAWAWRWISSTVGTLVVSAVGFFGRPFQTDTTNLLVGVLPIALFAAIIIAGPLVAAFNRDKEREKENEDLRAQVLTIQANNDALQRKLEVKPITKGEVRQLLLDVGLKGRGILHTGQGDRAAFIREAKLIMGDVLMRRKCNLFFKLGDDLARWVSDLVDGPLTEDDIKFHCARSRFQQHSSWANSQ